MGVLQGRAGGWPHKPGFYDILRRRARAGCGRIAPAAMPTERRKNPRVGLAIPMRVQGFLADGTTWEEITTRSTSPPAGRAFP